MSIAREVTLNGFISGRVQGVYFRVETRNRALHLGIRGWVRNVADGRVEVLIRGTEEAINEMKDWLAHGPSRASVTSLQFEPVEESRIEGFHVQNCW